VRTTVNIDDQLLLEAKAMALRTRRSLGQVIDDALRRSVGVADTGSERIQLPVFGGSGLRPGVDLEDREALTEVLGDNLSPDAGS
jgi:Arc/MetJ family transcription regulator